MSKNIESNKQTETQGELTTTPASCSSCDDRNDTNILTLSAKPEVRSAWLKVGVFISCLVLISLYLMGKLPLDALVAVLQLFSKLL